MRRLPGIPAEALLLGGWDESWIGAPVRFVHPGPLFHPPGEDQRPGIAPELAAADHGDLQRAGRALLGP